jgi:hypothetical protein
MCIANTQRRYPYAIGSQGDPYSPDKKKKNALGTSYHITIVFNNVILLIKKKKKKTLINTHAKHVIYLVSKINTYTDY